MTIKVAIAKTVKQPPIVRTIEAPVSGNTSGGLQKPTTGQLFPPNRP